MHLNDITPQNKWLLALSIYCLVIANTLWSLGSDAPLFTTGQLDSGGTTFTFSNVYRLLVILVNYVLIIHVIVNAFNGHPRATTFWVCLAALTLLYAYTIFGVCVLAYVLYPFVKRWMSAKFVQAVQSATASQPSTTPPNE